MFSFVSNTAVISPKKTKGLTQEKRNGRKKAQQWRYDLSYSRQQDEIQIADLLHDLCEVRAGVMRGALSSSSAAVPADKEQQTLLKLTSGLPLKPNRGEKMPVLASKHPCENSLLAKNNFRGNSKIISALISGNRICT